MRCIMGCDMILPPQARMANILAHSATCWLRGAGMTHSHVIITTRLGIRATALSCYGTRWEETHWPVPGLTIDKRTSVELGNIDRPQSVALVVGSKSSVVYHAAYEITFPKPIIAVCLEPLEIYFECIEYSFIGKLFVRTFENGQKCH